MESSVEEKTVQLDKNSNTKIKSNKYVKLSIQSKSQLHFGIAFNESICSLKVFIYGLRGVNM